jgi:hypothetical protein
MTSRASVLKRCLDLEEVAWAAALPMPCRFNEELLRYYEAFWDGKEGGGNLDALFDSDEQARNLNLELTRLSHLWQPVPRTFMRDYLKRLAPEYIRGTDESWDTWLVVQWARWRDDRVNALYDRLLEMYVKLLRERYGPLPELEQKGASS